MAYNPFTPGKPDIADTGGDIIADARNNIQALRDMMIFSGILPGWDLEKQNNNGTPSTDPTIPEQIVALRAAERLLIRMTYSGTGNIATAIGWYSSNSGTAYFLIADADYPLGKLTFTYNVDDIMTSWSWS